MVVIGSPVVSALGCWCSRLPGCDSIDELDKTSCPPGVLATSAFVVPAGSSGSTTAMAPAGVRRGDIAIFALATGVIASSSFDSECSDTIAAEEGLGDAAACSITTFVGLHRRTRLELLDGVAVCIGVKPVLMSKPAPSRERLDRPAGVRIRSIGRSAEESDSCAPVIL